MTAISRVSRGFRRSAVAVARAFTREPSRVRPREGSLEKVPPCCLQSGVTRPPGEALPVESYAIDSRPSTGAEAAGGARPAGASAAERDPAFDQSTGRSTEPTGDDRASRGVQAAHWIAPHHD